MDLSAVEAVEQSRANLLLRYPHYADYVNEDDSDELSVKTPLKLLKTISAQCSEPPKTRGDALEPSTSLDYDDEFDANLANAIMALSFTPRVSNVEAIDADATIAELESLAVVLPPQKDSAIPRSAPRNDDGEHSQNLYDSDGSSKRQTKRNLVHRYETEVPSLRQLSSSNRTGSFADLRPASGHEKVIGLHRRDPASRCISSRRLNPSAPGSDLNHTSPPPFSHAKQVQSQLASGRFSQRLPMEQDHSPSASVGIGRFNEELNPEKLQESSRTLKKPEVIHPSLKDGWKANRPGGQAPTYNKLNPVTDADRQLSDEKAPNRGFHFYPSNLNLLWDEDPHLCRGIFENDTKCPFANEPSRCQYRHYVHQETLDFVVTKRGVNTEFIKWILTNYTKNTPASVRKVFEQEAGKVLQVPPGPSAFEPPETTKSSAQREQRHPPAATANAAATEAALHTILGRGLSLRDLMSEEERERWGDHEHKIQRDDVATRAKREEVKKVEGPAGIPQLNETYKNDGKTILTVHPAQSATSTEPEQAPSPPRLPRKASVLSWSSEDQEPDDVHLSQKVASENPNLLAPSGAESGPPKPDRSYLEE